MELLTGESLAVKLARQEVLSVSEAAHVVLPVVSAVAAAHTRGIVHRDLKPENVFLHAPQGDTVVVKVLDFGIAKVTNLDLDTTNSTGLTGTGALLGTPMYMSPEQVFGEKDLDGRSDIWSLGVILCQCLSGIVPTKAENTGQVLKIVVAGRILPLQQVAPEVPTDLASMVDAMLARERDRRPAHLGPVVDVLRRCSTVTVPAFEAPRETRERSRWIETDDSATRQSARATGAGSSGLHRRARWRRWQKNAAVVAALVLGLGAVAGWRLGRRAAVEPVSPAAAPPSASPTPWGSSSIVRPANLSAETAFTGATRSSIATAAMCCV